jgi:hypothetical protein
MSRLQHKEPQRAGKQARFSSKGYGSISSNALVAEKPPGSGEAKEKTGNGQEGPDECKVLG